MIRSVSTDRITFVGHATVLIEIAGARLLTDPVLRDRVLHIRRHAASPDPETWRDIDAVLISHAHADHYDPPSVRRVGSGAQVIAPAGTRLALGLHAITGATMASVGDVIEVGGARVEAVKAAHDGRRWPVGRRVDALGYLIEGNGRRVYFAGDTAPFKGLGDIATDIDIALLPISGWGPHVRKRAHLDPETAAEAAAALNPRVVVPIHWGTLLQVGLADRREELFEGRLRAFTEAMKRLAPGVELRALMPGESTGLG
jgi:L-ascorbate metabolism protein UlaG (beta-lactamase superfamily)